MIVPLIVLVTMAAATKDMTNVIPVTNQEPYHKKIEGIALAILDGPLFIWGS
jgi:hypothetical protein